jgi:acylphosphatase
MKTIRIKIYGHVQGVFYRMSTKEKAKELNVKGFILNDPDGSVFIEAQGDEKNLSKLIEWCKTGPKHAHIDNVEYQVIPLKKKHRSFMIIHNYPK